MTSDRIFMNPRASGNTKIKGKKADNSIIDMLTFDPDLPVSNTNGNQLPSVQNIQNAAADKASYFFDAGGAGSIQTAVSSLMSVGNGDFTILVAGVFKQSTTADNLAFFYVDGNNFCFLQKNASNFIQLYQVGGAGLTTTSPTTILKVIDGVYQTIIVSRSGTTITVTLNGVSEIITGQTLRNIAGSPNFRISGDVGVTKHISRAALFSYVLPAAKLSRYSDGGKLDYEDNGASFANFLTVAAINSGSTFESGFSSTTSSWTGVNTASTGVAGILNLVGNLVVGKVYRLYFTASIPSGITVQVLLTNAAGSGARSSAYTITAGMTYIDLTVNAASTNFGLEFDVSGTSGSPTTFTGMSLVQNGAVLDLEPEGIGEGTWVDSSPNHLSGDVVGAIAQFPQDANPSQSVWNPTVTPVSNMTKPGSTTITGAKYRVSNGICFFECRITGLSITANGLTALTSFVFTTPPNVPTRNSSGYVNGTVVVYGTSNQDFGVVADSSGSNRSEIGGTFRALACGTGAATIDVSGWYFI